VARKQIQQVQLHGDFAGRKAVTYGKIKGSQNIAIGRGAQTAMDHHAGDQTSSLLEVAFGQTGSPLETAGFFDQDVQNLVQVVQAEAAKGSDADLEHLTTTLRQLAALSPEIFNTVAEWLTSPEIEQDIREVAQMARVSEQGQDRGSDFEQLTNQISTSSLSATVKQKLNHSLARLQAASSQSDNGAIQEFRAALQEIIEIMPELRRPLWRWLSNNSDIATPVKIIARRLLNQ
jgi:hypothetical protein